MIALLTEYRIWACPRCPGQTSVSTWPVNWMICRGNPERPGHLYPLAMREVDPRLVDPLWLARSVGLTQEEIAR